MAFQLKADETVAEGIPRIVLGQLDKALDELSGRRGNEPETVVHNTRRRFKKVRAALRLARAGLGRKLFDRENARFRDAGRPLSKVRDASVLVKSFDLLAQHFGDRIPPETVGSIRDALIAQEQATSRRVLDQEDVLESLIVVVAAARREVKDWEFVGEGWNVLAVGLKWIYRQGFRALRDAADGPFVENFHEWRKRVKDLWHALQILRPIRPRFMEDLANRARDLANCLGEDHDLAVLREALADPALEIVDRASVAQVIPLIDEHRAQLQRDAFDLGRRVYRDRARRFEARLAAYWRAWKAEVAAQRFDP